MTSPSPLDGRFIAHVADELQRAHGAEDYDVAADYAANLLTVYGYLVTSASAYADGTCGPVSFRRAVATAVAESDAAGGF